MATFNHVAKDYPSNLIDRYVYIYWKEDRVWYRAKVVRFHDISKKFKVIYDDKKEEKTDMTKEWFLFEDDELKALSVKRKKQLKA